MLTISPINNTSFKNIFSKNTEKNTIKSTNLMPLAKDTISFSGIRTLNPALMESFNNRPICDQIHENAFIAKKSLENTVKEICEKYNSQTEDNENSNIDYEVRVKSSSSIQEKVASILGDAIINHNINGLINPMSRTDIKKTLNDIVGARIILKETDTAKNSSIIEGLIEQVHNGTLNIENMDIIAPEEFDGKDLYFAKEDLKRLEEEVNLARFEQDKEDISIKFVNSKTGYIGFHIDLDLSNEDLPQKNAGYKGEIQILGRDTAKLKDVEDYCYKISQNKGIKNGDVAYSYFSDFLEKKLDDKNTKAQFDEYTRKAYVNQFKKNPTDENYNLEQIPTLEDCQMEGKLPENLDFNHLRKIKGKSDEFYEMKKVYNIDPGILSAIKMQYSLLNDTLDKYEPEVSALLKEYCIKLYELQENYNVEKDDINNIILNINAINEYTKKSCNNDSEKLKALYEELYDLTKE